MKHFLQYLYQKFCFRTVSSCGSPEVLVCAAEHFISDGIELSAGLLVIPAA